MATTTSSDNVVGILLSYQQGEFLSFRVSFILYENKQMFLNDERKSMFFKYYFD